VSASHAELVLGGILTGAVIGFFWHPLAALLVVLTAALIALRADRPAHDATASPEAAAWRQSSPTA
jgi:hypothetical protein